MIKLSDRGFRRTGSVSCDTRVLGYSQEVRQRTLTPSFRWFESIYPNQQRLIGVSPSGKATDSDSVIPKVRILLPQPVHSVHRKAPLPVTGWGSFYFIRSAAWLCDGLQRSGFVRSDSLKSAPLFLFTIHMDTAFCIVQGALFCRNMPMEMP